MRDYSRGARGEPFHLTATSQRHPSMRPRLNELRKSSRLVSQLAARVGSLGLSSGIARLAALVVTWHDSIPRSQQPPRALHLRATARQALALRNTSTYNRVPKVLRCSPAPASERMRSSR